MQSARALPCWLVALVLIVGCSGVVDEASDEGGRTPSVTKGWGDTLHPSAVEVHGGLSSCTGTVVGPRTVLTACHCVKPGKGATVVAGGKTIIVPASDVIRHPACLLTLLNIDENGIHDVAVLRLSEDAGVKPTPLATRAPYAGQKITIVGFGLTGYNETNYGTRRMGKTALETVKTQLLIFQGGPGTSASGVCGGDSGGPSFGMYGGKEALLGVHSFTGDLDDPNANGCGPDNGDMRVDAYWRWVLTASDGDALINTAAADGALEPEAGSRLEGEPCEVPNLCAPGLACVATKPNAPYCMNTCSTTLDCDGGEVCAPHKDSGKKVCDLATGFADDGFTYPTHYSHGWEGSCKGRCGNFALVPGSNPPCRCDNTCWWSQRRDCCRDRDALCAGQTTPKLASDSCLGRCGDVSWLLPIKPGTKGCICDKRCVKRGDCCKDFAQQCPWLAEN